ncbi:MAG: TetR/AcrR family transcriptional regulator [Rhizobacter sp.]
MPPRPRRIDSTEAAAAEAPRARIRRNAAAMAQLKRAILERAKEIHRTEGFAAISVRRLAKEFDLPPMTFYGYFPSKRALVGCLWVEICELLLDRLLAASRGLRSPFKVLESHMSAALSFWEENPDLYRLMYMYGGDEDPELPVDFGDDPVYAKLMDLIQERVSACAEGEPSADAVGKARSLMYATQLGYLHATIAAVRYPIVDRAWLRERIVQDALRGVQELLNGGGGADAAPIEPAKSARRKR